MIPSHETTVRVRYAETDQMGIVYHANYLVWMEVGRVEFFRSAGIRYRDLEAQDGILLAVIEASCRYISPARYDDEVIVKTEIAHATARMVQLKYELRHAETSRKLAEGETRHIFLSPQMKPTKLPEKYRESFGIS